MKSLPGLFNIEKESLSCILHYLFEFSHISSISDKIYTISKPLLDSINNKNCLKSERKEEIIKLETIVSRQLLPGLGKNVKDAINNIGNEILDLIVVDNIEIREEVRKLLKGHLVNN